LSNRSTVKSWMQFLFFLIVAWVAYDQFTQRSLLKRNVKVPEIIFDQAGTSDTVTIPFSESHTILYFFTPNTFESNLTALSVNLAKQFLPEGVKIIGVALNLDASLNVEEYRVQKLIVPVVIGGKKSSQIYKVSDDPVFYFVNRQRTVKSRTLGFTTPIGIVMRAWGIRDDSVDDKWWLKF